jgi:hypothetical protein
LSSLEQLFKASVHFHGQEQVPEDIIIFAVNHFARLESLILPYELFRATVEPLLSLACHELFGGI